MAADNTDSVKSIIRRGRRQRARIRRDAMAVIGAWCIAILLTTITVLIAFESEWWVVFFFGGNALGSWIGVYKIKRMSR